MIYEYDDRRGVREGATRSDQLNPVPFHISLPVMRNPVSLVGQQSRRETSHNAKRDRAPTPARHIPEVENETSGATQFREGLIESCYCPLFSK